MDRREKKIKRNTRHVVTGRNNKHIMRIVFFLSVQLDERVSDTSSKNSFVWVVKSERLKRN